MDKGRRSLLQAGALTAGYLLPAACGQDVIADLELLDRLRKAVKQPTTIDDPLLGLLTSGTQHFRKHFVLARNSLEDLLSCHHDLTVHVHRLTDLLTSSLPPSVRRSLSQVTAEALQVLGDLAFHLGQDGLAEHAYVLAFDLAGESEHPVLQAVLLGRRGIFFLYQQHPHEGVTVLEHAFLLATTHGASDLICAWLSALLAECYAQEGQKDDCQQQLARAQALLERQAPGRTTLSFEGEAPYLPFNRERFLGYQAACLLRLGLAREAEEILKQLLPTDGQVAAHRRSIRLLDLTMALVQQRRLEEAVSWGLEGLKSLEQTRSPRVLERALQVEQRLNRWREERLLTPLMEYLAHLKRSIPHGQSSPPDPEGRRAG
ncbi:hypothetical protein [Thermogemmatispora tikiterensis]|uniref:MalT-like TPR region domain-containing protein n=1 Tax=Thermogemmatispora tikiterensis TaxID=1825093 RepID=A0A328V8D8_9CHLR|nr:hypothetical protein [Thermogemmatispora tikiterensis]RAQ93897.1 hypothetical protein A4R35_00025 [Thermogemmatispora tikiterensis]